MDTPVTVVADSDAEETVAALRERISVLEQALKDQSLVVTPTITLFCLVRGQPTSNAFPVKIDPCRTIGELRELIKAKKPHDLDGVDADKLILGRVSIPITNDEAVVYDESAKRPLLPYQTVQAVCSKPEEGRVHVFIETPLNQAKPTRRKSFSQHRSLPEVLKKYGFHHKITEIPPFHPNQIHIDDDDPRLVHCVNDLKARIRSFGTTAARHESISREFISPVLVAAVLFTDGTQLDAESAIDGDISSGRVDYTVLRDAEYICVSEAKNQDFAAGITANLLQCDGSLDENRKQRCSSNEFDYVYGIVTTGYLWRYLLFTNERRGIYTTANTGGHFIPLGVECLQDDQELKRSVKQVVSTIAWMLLDRVTVGESPTEKKRRVEENTRVK